MKTRQVLAQRILEKARLSGASLAGLVPLSALREPIERFTRGWQGAVEQASLLVLALEHPEAEPELDWWGGEGGTEGNRRLIAASEQVQAFLAHELNVAARPLPYDPWRGGVLLKDAAVLAGLGSIGANNLLITPQYGTRVRLRALLIDLDVPLAPRSGYEPCASCPRPCWQACPQGAFASGTYERAACERQMKLDEQNAAARTQPGGAPGLVEYCRACEWACPAGQ
jgi:epoxyqueuosine reductase